MRFVAAAMLLALTSSCRRERTAPPQIHADPAPSASQAPEIGKLSVREISFVSDGPFELRLSYPHVELPSGGGAKISSTLEDDVRRRAHEQRDRWTATPHEGAASGSYQERCTPMLVAAEWVSVRCRGIVHDGGGYATALTMYTWTVENGEARTITLADVAGSAKLTALATQISTQLKKQIASSTVLSAKDLMARHALDAWSMVRQGITFDFLPRAVSAIDDELYTGVEWSALRSMAQDAALVDRMTAAATAPDTLFGYPTDAGP